ncbi:MAG: thioredoxin family protein, partial [Phycisphaeraceae bacterium]|nr:thioredoxin family protein [Phycisphaeraceae bacterium]
MVKKTTTWLVALVLTGLVTFAWAANRASEPLEVAGSGLPRLLDLGADKCIPCKKMAPILDAMKEEFAGRLQVDFIDVWKHPEEAPKYRVTTIPTQIFLSPDGKELFRHIGFFSREDILGKWKALGYEFKTAEAVSLERWEPARKDTRRKDQICTLCDGDINARTLVTIETDKGDVRLCSAHCTFILWSCLTEDKTDFEKKVSVTDWATRKRIPAIDAVFLSGREETTGHPWIKAFA